MTENAEEQTKAQNDTSPKLSITSLRSGSSARNNEALDSTLFTFKPKVSSVSAKIVETLGTDFMERQQQHLEKQRKNKQSRSMSPLFMSESPTEMKKSPKKKNKRNTISQSGLELNKEGFDGTKDLKASNKETPGEGDKSDLTVDQQLVNLKANSGQWSSTLKISQEVPTNPELLVETERSKTLPLSVYQPRLPRKMSHLTGDRLYQAKLATDKAVKLRKIFTIQGGYHSVRQSLRRRGWIEKFFMKPTSQRSLKVKRLKTDDDDDDADVSDDDDDDNDDDGLDNKNTGPKIPPWEEDDGIYGIMSRMIKYSTPTFYWVLKRDVVDFRKLTKDQIINHYCRAGSFTTKIGLCINMRNVPWYEHADPHDFFPRCYRICNDDDKEAFIDDYRLTSCASILQIALRIAIEQQKEAEQKKDDEQKSDGEKSPSQPDSPRSSPVPVKPCVSRKNCVTPRNSQVPRAYTKMKKPKSMLVPMEALHMSLQQTQRYIDIVNHDDIDTLDDPYLLNDSDWNQLMNWYYQLRCHGGYFEEISQNDLAQVKNLIGQLEIIKPQFKMDGTRNVWIIKPGAKSRGRGIMCYNKLEDMLKLVSAQVTKSEGKYVVQKYIERPLLIYNTKFDIRQWFLVTDWNPLTIWFYQDCYFRFCSQQFTLDNFDEAIHLSNNSIQKHYKNGPRSDNLPTENMWSHYQFINFLKGHNQDNKWEEVIYPGMKKAVICALQATQDIVEYRKLYGADFMLTEDLSPWLIEINSSPSMERSTAVTAKLCENVLDDTVKVVVDRKLDKNCDIGRFELAYKQSYVTVPPYVGLNICIEGQGIKRPDERKSKTDVFKESVMDGDECREYESDGEDQKSDSSAKENSPGKKILHKKTGRKSKKPELYSEKDEGEAVLRLQHDEGHPVKDNATSEVLMEKIRDLTAIHSLNSLFTDLVLPPLGDARLKNKSEKNIDAEVKPGPHYKKDGSKAMRKSLVLSQHEEAFLPIKRAKRFVSRTSVGHGYPTLPLPATFTSERHSMFVDERPIWDKCIHNKGSTNFPKTIIFPLPKHSDGKTIRRDAQKSTNTNKQLEGLNNLPLVPYSSTDIEKVLTGNRGHTRLRYLSVTKQLSGACICPPPKQYITSSQKGIYIHPLSY